MNVNDSSARRAAATAPRLGPQPRTVEDQAQAEDSVWRSGIGVETGLGADYAHHFVLWAHAVGDGRIVAVEQRRGYQVVLISPAHRVDCFVPAASRRSFRGRRADSPRALAWCIATAQLAVADAPG